MTEREQFTEAAKAAAWTVDNPDSADDGRTLVHCRGSFTGADWDLHAVLDEIENADAVWWDTDSSVSAIMGHQLACKTGDRLWHFEVRKPETGKASAV